MNTNVTITVFVLVLLAYALFGVVLFLQQKSFIYFPTNQDFDNCPGFSDAEKINKNGTRAYFKNNSDTLVVFYHGNAGSACDRVYIKSVIESAGHSYIIVEYAGYSADKRDPGKELLFQDVENISQFIEEKGFEKVLLLSESIGGAMAAHHTNVGRYEGALLISPFDSLGAVAYESFPFYPVKWLLTENYDNVEMLHDKKNIWIAHGVEDDIIPIEHSKKLFESIQGESKRYFEIEGAGHNDILGNKETGKIVDEFLK